jgi:hypothetical protein
MKCPHCDFQFRTMLVSANYLPDMAPVVCERCSNVALWDKPVIRKMTDEEMEALKKSPAWPVVEQCLVVVGKHRNAKMAAFN